MGIKNQRILLLSAVAIIAVTGMLIGALTYIVDKISKINPPETKQAVAVKSSTDDIVKVETRPNLGKKPGLEMPLQNMGGRGGAFDKRLVPQGFSQGLNQGFQPGGFQQGFHPDNMRMPPPEVLKKMRQGGGPNMRGAPPGMPQRPGEAGGPKGQGSPPMMPSMPNQGGGNQQSMPPYPPQMPPNMQDGGWPDDSYRGMPPNDYYPPPYWPEDGYDYPDEDFYPPWEGKLEPKISEGGRRVADGIDYSIEHQEEDPDVGIEDEYFFDTEE